jgi:hypothetical protein
VKFKQIGVYGVSVGWPDYTEGIEPFNAEVMALLRQAEVRS